MSRRGPIWSRRHFLRSASGALVVPALAGTPRLARAEDTPPQRLLVMWVPNGWLRTVYDPTGTGTDWTPSPIMEALAPVRPYVGCLSGLDNHPAVHPIRIDEHTGCTGATLTCTQPQSASSGGAGSGWSVDQIIADHIAADTAFPSLPLGSEEPLRCYTFDACPGFETISWRGHEAPLAKDMSVTSVFSRVFQGIDPSLTASERVARLSLEQSLLDGVRSDLAKYSATGGSIDARRLEQFTDGLRQLENRLQLQVTAPTCDVGYVPVETDDPTLRIQSMADMITLAFQCDRTRVVSWMLGTGRSERSLHFLGMGITHHELSHDSTWEAAHIAVGRWQVEQFVYMIDKLRNTPEADGSTLLDNTTVLFMSGMGEGVNHDPYAMNVLVAGGRNSCLGQRLVYPSGTPLANFYISLMEKFGVQQSTFGDDGTGSLLTL